MAPLVVLLDEDEVSRGVGLLVVTWLGPPTAAMALLLTTAVVQFRRRPSVSRLLCASAVLRPPPEHRDVARLSTRAQARRARGRHAGPMTTRAVDRLLQIFLGLVLVPVLAGVGFGLYLVGQDAQQSGEFLDGVGVLAGLVVIAVAGVPGTLAAIALSRSLRDVPGQRTYALAAGGLGAVATLLFAFFYAPAVAALVPALLVVATAVSARSATGDTFGA